MVDAMLVVLSTATFTRHQEARGEKMATLNVSRGAEIRAILVVDANSVAAGSIRGGCDGRNP
jgi:hypothetical protein